MMTTAYSYVRFSHTTQRKGFSVDRQLERSAQYAEEKGLTLDPSYKDTGVSAFKSKNRKKGALGRFLRAVEEGRIKKGSVLIVESLDRLSRDEPDTAFELVMSILRSGINITILSPFHELTKAHVNDLGTRVMIEVYVSRAHEETKTKSERHIANWRKKWAKAKDQKVTAKCPPWLRLSDDHKKFELIPERVAVVRKIYRMSLDGLGIFKISETLNHEGIAPFSAGRRKRAAKDWNYAYVKRVLRSRHVIGEIQPHEWRSGQRRRPVGNPIANYFPAIIERGDYYKVQKALDARRNNCCAAWNTGVRNLFTSLVKNSEDGCTMVVVDKGKRGSGPSMISGGAKVGRRGSKYVGFPLVVFETCMLRWVEGLSSRDILAKRNTSQIEMEIEEATGKLAEIDHRIGVINSRLDSDDNFEGLLDVLQKLRGRKRETEAKIEELSSGLKSDSDPALGNAKHIIQQLNEAESQEEMDELRAQLKVRIAELVERVEMTVQAYRGKGSYKGEQRAALVKVTWVGGKTRVFGVLARPNSKAGVDGLVIGRAFGLGDERERYPWQAQRAGFIPTWQRANGRWFFHAKENPPMKKA